MFQFRPALVRLRADQRGGKHIVALPGCEFIARLLQHVLPAGFKRIRHFGLRAAAAKTQRLAAARELLSMPAPNPVAIEHAQDFMRRVANIDIACCPHCRIGRWQLVQAMPADRAVLAATPPTACRGPP
ncbi:MAG: transposase [Aquabacterium sp.]|nr:transposase [Aquabacterium sp.]